MDTYFINTSIGLCDRAVAIGETAEASGVGAVALGNDAEALALQSVALGAGSIADRDNSVSVGRDGVERQIVHVSKGAKETDAVNLSQLNFIASILGDEIRCIDGIFYVPAYRVQGVDYNNIGTALAAVNRHISQIYAQLIDTQACPSIGASRHAA